MKYEEARIGDKVSYKDNYYTGIIKEVKMNYPSYVLLEVKSANLQEVGLKTVPEFVKIMNNNIEYLKKLNTMETE